MGSEEPDKVSSRGNGDSTKKEGKKTYQSGQTTIKGRGWTSGRFTGRCEDLQGHIYDCTDARSAAELYTTTTKELAEYVGTKCVRGADARIAIETGRLPTFIEPIAPQPGASEARRAIYTEQIKLFAKREDVLHENLRSTYSLIYGQCTDALRERIKAHEDYPRADRRADALLLLAIIKACMYRAQHNRNPQHMIHEAVRQFYLYRQDKGMTCEAYRRGFVNLVEVAEMAGASIGRDDNAVRDILRAERTFDIGNPSPAERVAAERQAKEQYLAVAFLLGANRDRYGKLIEDIENAMVQGNDTYPKTVNDAYNLLLHWKHNPRNVMRALNMSAMGGAFMQDGEEEERGSVHANNGRQGKDKSHIKCFRCKKMGHYANECPDKKKNETEGDTTGASMFLADLHGVESEDSVTGFQFSQGRRGAIPSHWILLDNQSTVDIFSNPDMLEGIHDCGKTLHLHCNAGVMSTRMMGTLPGYGPVWYHADAIANILSLSRVREKCKVTFNSEEGNQFVVTKDDGSRRVFKQSGSGLYYTSKKHNHVFAIETVAENKAPYSERAYQRALTARRFQETIGCPSTSAFIKVIQHKQILNCPVTVADVQTAEKILGPSIAGLKGKTTRKKGVPVTSEITGVPPAILTAHKRVTLCMDLMYINKLPFLITFSRGIRYGTAEHLPSRRKSAIIRSLKRIFQLYSHRGFVVQELLGDGEFKSMEGELLEAGFPANIAGRGEHVPDVERYIRTVKERCRSTMSTLPFKQVPRLMVCELVYSSIFWLNAIPPKDGASEVISPRTIMTGRELDFVKHCSLQHGAYVQATEESSKTMRERTIGAIALRPTGNEQGGQYFMSLGTGKRIHRVAWRRLPMPAEAIDRVHKLARRSLAAKTIIFERSDGETFAPDLDETIPGDDDPDPFGPDIPPVEDDESDDSTYNDDDAGMPEDADDDMSDLPALRPRYDSDSDSDSDDDEDDDFQVPPTRRAGVSGRHLNPNPAGRHRRGLFSTTDDEHDPDEDADPDNGGEQPGAAGGDDEDPDNGDDEQQDGSTGNADVSGSSVASQGLGGPDDDVAMDDVMPALTPDVSPDQDQEYQSDPDTTDHIRTASSDDQDQSTTADRPGSLSHEDQYVPEGSEVSENSMEQPEKGQKRSTTSMAHAGDRGHLASEPQEHEGTNGLNPIDAVDDDPLFYQPAEQEPELDDAARRRRARLARLRRQLGDHNRRGRQERTVTFAPDDSYSLRSRKPSSYGHVHAGLEDVLMTQYPVKKGLKIFGKKGSDAVVSEMRQLHDMEVLKPKKASMLTEKERKQALPYLLFLTEKRCGKIKARGCADGRRQRVYKTKEETSSPTVALESVFLTSLIDAKEGRKVATVDVPGAFMQSEMDEVVHMRIDGEAAKLLLEVDRETYEPFLAQEKGKPVLYVQLMKALYGTLQAAYLFWLDLTAELEKLGFVKNDYDLCVANKTINGKQCTVVWHVDDLKISHMEQSVIDDIIQKLQDRYGKLKPLTVTRGSVHDYLGMTLDFSVKGKVMVKMLDYVKKLVDIAPKSMSGIAATPANDDLFDRYDDDSPKLGEVEKEAHHTLVAKLLFLAKRSRPDVLTPVSYLTTRVTCPNQADWKKLSRVIQYLRGTQEMFLTLEAENINVVKWWVDGSFAVHGDMRSHTGGTMSMGKGSVFSTSTKQKLNTRSSTESELVAVDDVMPHILWTKNFLRSQGYKTDPSRVYQDNLSTMLLAKNGRRSAGRRTRHLDIRYFFVTDRIGAGDVILQHCPTSLMVGDFFTKPLQGSQFKRLRDQILNWK